MTLSRAQQAHLKSAQELATIAGVELTVNIEELFSRTSLRITGKTSNDVWITFYVGPRGAIKFAGGMSGYYRITEKRVKSLAANQRWLREEILKQRKAA
tara:strand:+ start:32 stop:328 length:297 start_codon:yes stop_codon:yes gene_type:complete